ncbi:MAG: hypothetical protein AB3K77_08775 [Methanosarcinaceae archaeon]
MACKGTSFQEKFPGCAGNPCKTTHKTNLQNKPSKRTFKTNLQNEPSKQTLHSEPSKTNPPKRTFKTNLQNEPAKRTFKTNLQNDHLGAIALYVSGEPYHNILVLRGRNE